jgi:hypothetical protein
MRRAPAGDRIRWRGSPPAPAARVGSRAADRLGVARLDHLLEPFEVRLEDRAEDRLLDDLAQVREGRRNEPLVPAHERTPRVQRLQRDPPGSGEDTHVPDPERHRGIVDVDLHQVHHADQKDPDVRLAARPDPRRTRREEAHGLHLVHPERLPLDVRHGFPDRLDRRVDRDRHLHDRIRPLARRDQRAEPALGRHGRAQAGRTEQQEPRQPAHEAPSTAAPAGCTSSTPASASSRSARAPSPACRSTARTPSTRTLVG